MLTIDLTAVQSNWLQISAIASGSSVAGVIKANAYGLGAPQIGCALYNVGCREFFFATLDEAVRARAFLPADTVIYVLGGIRQGDEINFIESNLIPVLCSLQDIKSWAKKNAELAMSAPCALKINTGMTRFGLSINELIELCVHPDLLMTINLTLLMSHLACADESAHQLNLYQNEKFTQCAQWVKKIFPRVRLSLANSSGIFLGAPWHYDVVRPGAALYGINPAPGCKNPLKAVVKLALPVMQVRTLEEVSNVGYGAGASLPAGARIAVVAGGYADGLHRTVGLEPEGVVCGHKVKAIGRISMDVTMFDISALRQSPEQLLSESIEVINDELSLEHLSKKNNLLGYEALTSLGNRYKRNYLPGGAHE